MKKCLSRIATYLLILMMIMTNLPMVDAAPAEYGSLQLSQANPHFAGLETPLQITQTAPLYFSDGEEPTYHTDPAAAAAVIRDAMEARQESFSVGYSVPEKLPENEEDLEAWFKGIAFDLLLEKAFDETENATEGDSLRFCYHYMNLPIQYVSYPDYTDILFTYVPTYFTSAAQEAELTAAVDTLLEDFAFTAQTNEREKIDAIYTWLCANVDYDYTSSGYLKHSAYAAMVNKSAVCQGYAVLFYRLAEEAGLDARVITGVASHNQEAHGWNIARLGDSYYYLDATWDANKEPQDYDYYLRGESDFYGHSNDAKYETEEFCARYPMAVEGISELHGTELDPCAWQLEKNEASHWYQCTVCGNIKEEEGHSGGQATCIKQAICTVCLKAYGALKSHQWTNDCDTECNACQTTRTVSHQFGGYVYNNDATSQKDGTQTRTCIVCSAKQTITAAGTRIENPFKDVKAKEYYTEPVLWAVGEGITNGTGKDTFSPANNCTRGQIVTFLWRAAGSPEPQSARNPFKDVKSNQYYYKAVLWAVEKGITTGTSANTFSPDAACTRGQVVTFLWRAKGKPAATAANAFKDVQKSAYYYDAVLWAVKNEITNGMDVGIFAPEVTCTRGQIVTFLHRAYA